MPESEESMMTISVADWRQIRDMASAWREVYTLCGALGMDGPRLNQNGRQAVALFIRDLARRADQALPPPPARQEELDMEDDDQLDLEALEDEPVTA